MQNSPSVIYFLDSEQHLSPALGNLARWLVVVKLVFLQVCAWNWCQDSGEGELGQGRKRIITKTSSTILPNLRGFLLVFVANKSRESRSRFFVLET